MQAVRSLSIAAAACSASRERTPASTAGHSSFRNALADAARFGRRSTASFSASSILPASYSA
jgi:hypothetical protein